MKPYLLAAATGLVVGIFYALSGVRSPAPPVVALIGLLAMLAGEQIPPLLRGLWNRESAAQSWLLQIKPHVFGHLPKGAPPERRDT